MSQRGSAEEGVCTEVIEQRPGRTWGVDDKTRMSWRRNQFQQVSATTYKKKSATTKERSHKDKNQFHNAKIKGRQLHRCKAMSYKRVNKQARRKKKKRGHTTRDNGT